MDTGKKATSNYAPKSGPRRDRRNRVQGRAMYKIRLSNFRCFAEDTPQVEVLPITFLVGENSAGKTSFLAATRIMLETFMPGALNPFNREPYRLGAFEQIAHWRGGRVGRAQRFCLEIVTPISGVELCHKFTFGPGSPQPELNEYEFAAEDASTTLKLSGNEASISITKGGKVLLQYTPERVPSPRLVRKDPSYVRYIFQDLIIDRPGEPEELKVLRKQIHRQFNSSLRARMQRNVFASAPIRSQPYRTYTPSEVLASAEGAHVPLEMAQQKRLATETWNRSRESLNLFGKKSGLFNDIDIRLLGKKDGDPFQLTVKTGGPAMNIVDVGYGVSQALPIIYTLEQARQYEIYLLQQPEVHLHPRAQAELGTLIGRVSKQRPAGKVQLVETHSDYIIDRVRIEVGQKRIDHKMVTIVFFEKTDHGAKPTNIYLDENGELVDPPNHFRSFFLQEQRRLLGI